MVLNVHRNHGLLGTGRRGGGEGVWRWGEREIIYLSLHCHHQNDFCIKMGSDESHFNVSVGSDGRSHKAVSTKHNLFEGKGEPKRYRTEVFPLTSLTPYRWAKRLTEVVLLSCCLTSTEARWPVRDGLGCPTAPLLIYPCCLFKSKRRVGRWLNSCEKCSSPSLRE